MGNKREKRQASEQASAPSNGLSATGTIAPPAGKGVNGSPGPQRNSVLDPSALAALRENFTSPSERKERRLTASSPAEQFAQRERIYEEAVGLQDQIGAARQQLDLLRSLVSSDTVLEKQKVMHRKEIQRLSKLIVDLQERLGRPEYTPVVRDGQVHPPNSANAYQPLAPGHQVYDSASQGVPIYASATDGEGLSGTPQKPTYAYAEGGPQSSEYDDIGDALGLPPRDANGRRRPTIRVPGAGTSTSTVDAPVASKNRPASEFHPELPGADPALYTEVARTTSTDSEAAPADGDYAMPNAPSSGPEYLAVGDQNQTMPVYGQAGDVTTVVPVALAAGTPSPSAVPVAQPSGELYTENGKHQVRARVPNGQPADDESGFGFGQVAAGNQVNGGYDAGQAGRPSVYETIAEPTKNSTGGAAGNRVNDSYDAGQPPAEGDYEAIEFGGQGGTTVTYDNMPEGNEPADRTYANADQVSLGAGGTWGRNRFPGLQGLGEEGSPTKKRLVTVESGDRRRRSVFLLVLLAFVVVAAVAAIAAVLATRKSSSPDGGGVVNQEEDPTPAAVVAGTTTEQPVITTEMITTTAKQVATTLAAAATTTGLKATVTELVTTTVNAVLTTLSPLTNALTSTAEPASSITEIPVDETTTLEPDTTTKQPATDAPTAPGTSSTAPGTSTSTGPTPAPSTASQTPARTTSTSSAPLARSSSTGVPTEPDTTKEATDGPTSTAAATDPTTSNAPTDAPTTSSAKSDAPTQTDATGFTSTTTTTTSTTPTTEDPNKCTVELCNEAAKKVNSGDRSEWDRRGCGFDHSFGAFCP